MEKGGKVKKQGVSGFPGKGVEQPPGPGSLAGGPPGSSGGGSPVSGDLPSRSPSSWPFGGTGERRHSGRLDLRSFENHAAGAAVASTCNQLKGLRGFICPNGLHQKNLRCRDPKTFRKLLRRGW